MAAELPEIKSSSFFGKIFRRLFAIIVWILIFGLFITLIIQIPFVQQFVKNKAENYLEKKLETPVSIQKIKLEWLSKIGIDKLLIENQLKDTILFVGHAGLSINMNIIEIIRQHFVINDVSLHSITIDDSKVGPDSMSDFNMVIKKLFQSRSTAGTATTKSALELDLKNISLSNIRYLSGAKSNQSDYFIRNGLILVKELDFQNKKFIIENIELDEPIIKIEKSTSRSQKSDFTFFNDTIIQIAVDRVAINKGYLSFHGWPESHVLHHFNAGTDGVQIRLDSIRLQKGKLKMKIAEAHILSQDNIGITSFSAEEVVMSNKIIALKGYNLTTPASNLKSSIELQFDSFKSFNQFSDLVSFNANFKSSEISLQELASYIPGMEKTDFVKRYASDLIRLEGIISGPINKLQGRGVQLRLGNKFSYTGGFELNNITKKEETNISLRVESMQSNSKVLTDLLPSLGKLSNFSKLGQITYKGNVDGSLKDFVAYGILNSNLGYSKLDVHLNTEKGIEKATYRGEVELIDFDLRRWTDDPNFGTITLLAKITDGSGLKGSTASANLETTIKKFEFKEYDYANINFKGSLNKQLLDGILNIHDPNADLDFEGKIDFTKPVPEYTFVSNIATLDLYKLNLSKKPLSFTGLLDFNLKGKKLDDLQGTLNLKEAKIKSDSSVNVLRELTLISSFTSKSERRISVTSDWMDATVEGIYSITKIWPSLKDQLIRQFPDIAQTLKLKRSNLGDTVINQRYKFELNGKDVSALRDLAHLNIEAKPFHIEGSVIDLENYMLASWNIPYLKINDMTVVNSVGRVEAKGGIAYTSARIDSTFSKSFNMPFMVLTADMAYNKANFSIVTPKVTNLVNNIDLRGTLELIDSTYHMKFSSSAVSFLDRKWNILPDNEIAFRRGYIQTRNLQFVNGKEKIVVSSAGINGLNLDVTELDINFLNKLKPVPQWKLDGKLNFKANVDDVFTFKGLKVSGIVDSLFINSSYFGLIDFNAHTPTVDQPIQIDLAILDQSRQLIGKGFFDISGKFSNGIKNNYQMKFVFKDYPLRLFEYLMDDIIDNTKGNIVGNFEINKTPEGPDFAGSIKIRNGGFKVNYLATNYTIGDQAITINNKMIDATGVKIFDEYSNAGTITGGLPHDRFKNFRLNAGLSSPKLLVLKTNKELNKDYYGTLLGNVVAKFEGPFDAINFDIKGTTGRGSVLSIPISQATVTTGERIVQYRPVEKEQIKSTLPPKRILASKGISVDIDLTVTNEAEISLIFDEKRGDILKGTGTGDIQMKFDRNGDISMYGNYEVIQGEYLFTLIGLINKPFVIKPGGTIRWNGDPLGAILNLNAEYKGLSSSMYNLLLDYQGTIDENELRSQVAVDLGMNITGELFKPDISFNLEIPNLTGNLKSVVDSKLNILRSDQNALNQQVMGLMVWGSFLPPNQLIAQDKLTNSTINNLSQFISNQLSLIVENALRELVADNNVISGFDFDVNYYNNTYGTSTQNLNQATIIDEVAISVGPKFFGNKLSVGLGANFVNSSTYNRLITPHFEVEYALTADRRLKIKAYARKDDINQGQLKDRIGGGISWRKEFDSAKDFKRKLKEELDDTDRKNTEKKPSL